MWVEVDEHVFHFSFFYGDTKQQNETSIQTIDFSYSFPEIRTVADPGEMQGVQLHPPLKFKYVLLFLFLGLFEGERGCSSLF